MTPDQSLARFCPHLPTEKQHAFLSATAMEVFFGGAAGGGKSVALLMGALQYVHIPGHAALILRKDTQRLALAGGLIPRSHEWLANAEGVNWNAARRQWSFTTDGAPATITFGYLAAEHDKFRYASSEFQYIAFDELTELLEADYLFLFSRLRRAKTLGAPLRIRSASNPGNIGHAWVKRRFVDRESGVGNRESDRLYIPSRLADNPHLSGEEYARALAHLGPVERERLLHGDWEVMEQGEIQAKWLRYYTQPETWNLKPETLTLLEPDGRTLVVVDPAKCRRFVTVDPAGTSAERARERRGRAPSYSVAQVWEQPRSRELAHLLILRHQVRGLFGFDELLAALENLNKTWRPERIWIENEKLGQATVDIARQSLPIEPIPTLQRDKLTRAARLTLKLSRGEIFLPKYETAWRPDFEQELLAWKGTDAEQTDQIDAAAYAAIVAETQTPHVITVLPIGAGLRRE